MADSFDYIGKMVNFRLFLLDHMFIKKEENKVLILQLFKNIYKLIFINFSDWVYVSKFNIYREIWKMFPTIKNNFIGILKSIINQKHLDIRKPYYLVKAQYQSTPVRTEIKRGLPLSLPGSHDLN